MRRVCVLAGNVAVLDVVRSWFGRHVFVSSRHVGLDTADVSVTSCDVGFFFSMSVPYAMLLPNCRHVVVVTTTTYHTHPV